MGEEARDAMLVHTVCGLTRYEKVEWSEGLIEDGDSEP